jgi:hypothetical protein
MRHHHQRAGFRPSRYDRARPRRQFADAVTQREGVVEGRGEFDQTKVHQGRRLLAPTPLRTHELANGNVLTAKLLAEPAGLGAAFVIEIALGRAVVESEPGRIPSLASPSGAPMSAPEREALVA